MINPIQTFGLSAAGFTPLLCCLAYSQSSAIFELLTKSGAEALVVDTRLPGMPDLSGCPVEVVDIASSDTVTSEVAFESLAPPPYAEVKDDIALIFHSSSSTSNVPKLIPRSHSDIISAGARFAFAEVAVRMGNFNHASGRTRMFSYFFHIGETYFLWTELVGCMLNGGSILIPSSLPFSADELGNMIRTCGLTTLTLITPMLVPLLQIAQSDPDVLWMVKSLHSIRCLGTAFPADMAGWCQSIRLPITVCTQSALISLTNVL